MLKILNLKINNSKPSQITKEGKYSKKNKKFIPANQEWQNSIYTFNKYKVKLLPSFDIYITKLLKGFFSMFSRKLEESIKPKRKNIRRRRLSVNRILISRPYLKHTNDKLTITLYIYNNQLTRYLKKIRRLKILEVLNPKLVKYNLNKIRFRISKLRKRMTTIKNVLISTLKWNKHNLYMHEFNIYKKFIKKSLQRESLYLRIRQLIFFNKSKHHNTSIMPLKILLEKIYKKKIEFNLVNLKYYHLNSDIYFQILALRLRNRSNRILRVINSSLRSIKFRSNFRMAHLNDDHIVIRRIQNNIVYNTVNFTQILSKDSLDIVLDKRFSNSKAKLEETVFKSIKYKAFSGIRIEASGRLSRRITAQRALHKFKYRGNIRDYYSSYVKLSTTILRGNINSSVQRTKVNSTTRIGAFGLKGWINSV